VQRLAMQAAKLQLRNGTHAPNGEGPLADPPATTPSPNGDGRAEPTPVPDTSGGLPPASSGRPRCSNQQQATKEAPAGNLLPFKARSSDGSARRGTARTQSGDLPGAPPGDACSNPRANQADDDAFWTAGEQAVWQLAQEMRTE
jgi:hypothetical protein